ncbi:MAG: MBL fold metallo-hydrolase [Nitriliruptoraceae bacterium]|nr:MBL fold metallo-hydrolase [Nitriliruptoraceae bacterium]
MTGAGAPGPSGVSDPGPAPEDPRRGWDLPAFGGLARTTALDEVVVRVLADNASPMTLDGTNTYLVGAPGTGEVLIVDPGPDDPDHRQRVDEAIAARDAAVRAIVVTHHHLDHAEAAAAWGRAHGVEVVARAGEVAVPSTATVGDGDRIGLAGLDVEVVATPGHTRDHIALRLGSGALLTGDHVLGRGSSVVAAPDGDLNAYLTSLRRVLDLGPDVLYPGHGPALREDPSAVIRYYLEHRSYRERQILALLAAGARGPRALVETIYAEVDRRLWDAAEASTRATLDALVERGAVRIDPEGVAHLLEP